MLEDRRRKTLRYSEGMHGGFQEPWTFGLVVAGVLLNGVLFTITRNPIVALI